MSRPLIYLYQEHVADFFRERGQAGGTAEKKALGMALDDGDVFHVYLAPPQAHFSGRPCSATVRFVEGPPADGDAKPSDDGRMHVVVVLGVEGDVVKARGFSVLDGRIQEGDVFFVPMRTELYARSKGLLEIGLLEKASIAVVGLGSGGSSVALALAQAGIGRMVLIDRDRLEATNVARHVCGVGDLGRYKTRAMRDILLGKNPYLQIEAHEIDILERPDDLRRVVEGCDLIVAATDSDRSRFALNQLALELRKPAVFGRVLARAAGGDVLRLRPYEGPCLACIYTEQFLAQRQREYSSLKEARQDAPAYVSDEDLSAKIQVGLASDIAPISNFMVKLILSDLSQGRGGGLESLAEDLKADFYVWANRREGVYAGWPPMGHGFNQPSALRWYGAAAARDPTCLACGLDPAKAAAGDIDFFGA